MAETVVYCATIDRTLIGGATAVLQFSINNPNRKLKIKSILLDWIAQETISNVIIPFAQNTYEYVRLTVGNYPASSKIGSDFTPDPIIPFTTSGTAFHMSKPGQYNFNSFFSANTIPFYFILNNTSAISIRNFVSLICEIEGKNIYMS